MDKCRSDKAASNKEKDEEKSLKSHLEVQKRHSLGAISKIEE